MALTDENVLVMAMYLFTFSFMFALGMRKHPLFYILCGIVGISFAVELFTLVQSTILTTVLSGISMVIIIFGFTHRPKPEIRT